MKNKILEIINKYWSFDNNQQHTHSWHDKQDCINEINDLLSNSNLTDDEINLLAEKRYSMVGYKHHKEGFLFGFKKCQQLYDKNE